MKKNISLIENNVMRLLIVLTLPMIAANVAQTAFGLIDMVWIGSLGSGAVSSVGTASFYLNLAVAIATIVTVGTTTRYAQSIGADDHSSSKKYFSSSIILTMVIAILFFTFIYYFASNLIAFYEINDIDVVQNAIKYLKASLLGTPFLFFSLTFTALLTSKGKTKNILKANLIGLGINLILDPILIFGYLGFPEMGVIGAAWATNLSRLATMTILLYALKDDIKESFVPRWNKVESINIIKMSLPVTLQRVTFIFISMYMAKIIAGFGTDAIAAQKIGLQIESITFTMIGGLQGALVAFVGQNYGAHQLNRIREGYNLSLLFAIAFSAIMTTLFLTIPDRLLGLFISEPEVITIGAGYLRAIGFSQIFMCVEYITVGVFNGIGKTYIPPLISITLTAFRIPLALFLIRYLGVSGIWWSISITSVLKGVINYFWMKVVMSRGGYNEPQFV